MHELREFQTEMQRLHEDMRDIIRELDQASDADLMYFIDSAGWDHTVIPTKNESGRSYQYFTDDFINEAKSHLLPVMTNRQKELAIECCKGARLAQEFLWEKPEIADWMKFNSSLDQIRDRIEVLQSSGNSVDEIVEAVIRKAIWKNESLTDKSLASDLMSSIGFLELQKMFLGRIVCRDSKMSSLDHRTVCNLISKIRADMQLSKRPRKSAKSLEANHI